MKLHTFHKKNYPFLQKTYPPFIENYGPPPYRKLQPLISAFIENSIFGNNKRPQLLCNFKMRQKSTYKFPFSGPPSNGDLPPCYPKKHEQSKLCSSCHGLCAEHDEVDYIFHMFQ